MNDNQYINQQITRIQRSPLSGARQRRDEQPHRERSTARHNDAANRSTA